MQVRMPANRPIVPDCNAQRFLGPDDYHELFASSHASVQQVPLEHDVMLNQYRDHHRWIF